MSKQRSTEQGKPSDAVIRVFFLLGISVGVALPILIRELAQDHAGAAQWVGRGQAVVAGALIPIVVVLGMLNYLDTTPSVRLLKRVQKLSDKAAEVLAELRSRRAWVSIFAVGYVAGASIIALFTSVLDEAGFE